MLIVKRLIISFILLAIIVEISPAQTDDGGMFRKGVKLYKMQDFNSAQNVFLKILKNNPNSSLLTATKLMLAKTYYREKEYKFAKIVCNNFEKLYKESAYLDDVRFLQGKILFRQEQYVPAVEAWFKVVEKQSDPRLKKKAGDFAFHTMVNYCTEKDLSKLRQKYDQEPLRGLLEIIEANKLIKAGKKDAGIRQLHTFLEKSPYHPYAEIARKILESKTTSHAAENSFLVIKSSRKEMNFVSEAITEGLYYAAYEINSRFPEKKIKIDSLRFQGNLLNTIEGTLTSLQEKDPVAVVGALNNDETDALALISRYENFPFVAPLSSQNGLADLAPFTFQINPDAEIKGRFLAEYATTELDAKTFAILAPADAYGESIANSFEKDVLKNGGEVVEKQWYYKGAEDFSRQFKAIRKKGFYIAYRDSVLADDPEKDPAEIRRQFAAYKNEKLFSNENARGTVDSTQVPSTGIDALFIALYPQDISLVAPQFAFNNIQTILLGNEGWNDLDQLKSNRLYVDGLVFITNGYYDQQSWNYREFLSRFRQKIKITPGYYHLLGYDVGEWMLQNYEPGMTRNDFRESLQNSKPYQGILTDISFSGKPRVNNGLNIIKFYMGQFLKIK